MSGHELQPPAQQTRPLPSEGQAQPDAPLGGGGGFATPTERLEDGPTIGPFDSRAGVDHVEVKLAVVTRELNEDHGLFGLPSVTAGVVNQNAGNLMEQVGIRAESRSVRHLILRAGLDTVGRTTLLQGLGNLAEHRRSVRLDRVQLDLVILETGILQNTLNETREPHRLAVESIEILLV
jgi:hypothetical protein